MTNTPSFEFVLAGYRVDFGLAFRHHAYFEDKARAEKYAAERSHFGTPALIVELYEKKKEGAQ